MLKLVKKQKLISSIAFAFATLTRSNGIFYSGFFIWIALHVSGPILYRIRTYLNLIICIALSITPFIWFQMKGIYLFCFENYKPTWCQNSIPLIYSHGKYLRSNVTVQSYYWNNGFLKYYTINQIPNFFLALPTFSIISFAIYDYFKYDKIRFLTLGFKKGVNVTKGYFSHKILPFIYLNVAMLLVVSLFMHVQVKFHYDLKVIVRFFTSSPIIYWYLANILSSNDYNRSYIARWYIGYSVIYGTIAIALFSNFLPPA
jgi:phosphatidylinositol glycan class V